MYYIYILASQKNGTLYVGITEDLTKRIWEHKNDLVDGFTKIHQIHQIHTLVYYESCEDIKNALHRESNSKDIIESGNWSL